MWCLVSTHLFQCRKLQFKYDDKLGNLTVEHVVSGQHNLWLETDKGGESRCRLQPHFQIILLYLGNCKVQPYFQLILLFLGN